MSEQTQELDLNGEMLVRREKLAALRAKGNPFPNTFRRDALAQDLHANYDALEGEALKAQEVEVKVAGRIMTRRAMGKATLSPCKICLVVFNSISHVIICQKVFMLTMWDSGI